MPKLQPPKPQGERGVYPRWSRRLEAYVWDATATVDGVQKQSRGHASKALARAARDQMAVDMRGGVLGKASARMTVEDLVTKHWLPAKKAELTNEKSIAGCEWAAGFITRSKLAPVRLTKLTSEQIEAWKRYLVATGMKPNSVRLVFMRFREILKWAQETEMIYRRPGMKVRAPKGEPYEPPPLNLDSILNLLEVAAKTPSASLVVYLACTTGFREESELFSLTWAQIDFHTGTASVKAKTPSGKRTIPIAAATLDLLREHRQQQMATFAADSLPPPAHVLLNEQGRPWKRPAFWWKWNAIRHAAGLPTLRFHDLRHVQATLLGKAGVSVKVAQARMGHADGGMTMHYTHLIDGADRDAAEAVDALLRTVRLPNP